MGATLCAPRKKKTVSRQIMTQLNQNLELIQVLAQIIANTNVLETTFGLDDIYNYSRKFIDLISVSGFSGLINVI